MKLNKIVIGTRFNKKTFRLSSLGGLIIDEILGLRESNKKLSNDFLTKFTSSNDASNLHVKFIDDKGINTLTIQSDQFVFSKVAPNEDATVNLDKVIEEFEILWKAANKILNFPDIRRIGIVGEYNIKATNETSASNQLISTMLKWKAPEHSGHFSLEFEDRELHADGSVPDKETADYWNSIYTFYPSEEDRENSQTGKINANCDIQKYYNPAKSDPIRELQAIKKKFIAKKTDFKSKVKEMGLTK
jgi:hypothetical protein